MTEERIRRILDKQIPIEHDDYADIRSLVLWAFKAKAVMDIIDNDLYDGGPELVAVLKEFPNEIPPNERN